MPRIRRPRAADAFPYDLTPKTSEDTFAAAAAVLTARGWINGETFRMRPTSVRADEVFLAPIVGGNDVSPAPVASNGRTRSTGTGGARPHTTWPKR